MRIAFLCSSLAPGRDGVGDYVRLLASSCAGEGHECLLVALNDRHLSGHEASGGSGTIRLAQGASWRSKALRLREALEGFGPDWVSWHIVSYGFSSRGIIPSQAALLADATRPWRRHAMLHELWLGISRGEGTRARVVGALQRHHLLRLLERIRPTAVHTSNGAYQAALRRAGWNAGVLPLFGNIPVFPARREAAKSRLHELARERMPSGPVAVGILFGTIHPQWDADATLAWLHEASRASGRRILVLALGRGGGHAPAKLARMNEGGRVFAWHLGELPAALLSEILQASDFAVATHPWALIGKSGTTATLLEHGLPVLVPRDDWRLREGPTPGPADPLLSRMADTAPRDFAALLGRRREPAPRLAEITARLCAELSGQPVTA